MKLNIVSLVFVIAILSCLIGDSIMREDGQICQSIASLRSPDCSVRLRAVQRLADLGSTAATAVPALIDAMDDPEIEVTMAIGEALKRIGNPAIPYLVRVMKDPAADERTRYNAADAIGDFGSSGIPALLDAMEDPAPDVRMMAIEALHRAGTAAEVAVPRLAEYLYDNTDDLSHSAALALAQLAALHPDPTQQTSQSLDFLLAGLTHDDPTVRREVSAALEFMAEFRRARGITNVWGEGGR